MSEQKQDDATWIWVGLSPQYPRSILIVTHPKQPNQEVIPLSHDAAFALAKALSKPDDAAAVATCLMRLLSPETITEGHPATEKPRDPARRMDS